MKFARRHHKLFANFHGGLFSGFGRSVHHLSYGKPHRISVNEKKRHMNNVMMMTTTTTMSMAFACIIDGSDHRTTGYDQERSGATTKALDTQ